MLYLLIIALSIAADQLVKLWVVGHLALFESAPLLPGFVELMYIRNTGGGFSILSGHTWVLTLFTSILMLAVAVLMIRRRFPHPLAMWSMALILGGGIGNLIDRIRLGFVVDMFHFEFWPSYPVFNVADILVVCGVILFAVYYLFIHDKVTTDKKEEPEHGADADTHSDT